jgi:hypothetical protein
MTEDTEKQLTQHTSYKKEIIIGAAVVIGILVSIGLIAFAIKNSGPNIVYQPLTACTYLTGTEARTLMGDKTLSTNNDSPAIKGDLATTKCGYADGNPDNAALRVAALVVRSGINDNGVEQNRSEFTNGTPTQAIETINDIGDKAYFNLANGQLNVLKGRDWFILNYGLGSSPESNSVEDSVKLAKLVLN